MLIHLATNEVEVPPAFTMSIVTLDKFFKEDSSLDTKAVRANEIIFRIVYCYFGQVIFALWESRTDISTLEILVDILM